MLLPLLFVLLIISSSTAINMDLYYGSGCPHCANTEKMFEKLGGEYELNITSYEVYYNADNRERMFREYERFGVDPVKGGVPTSVVGGNALVIGELTEEQWRELFDECEKNVCPKGVYTQKDFSIIHEKDDITTITWPVLISAALVDSINPCTIAIMVILLGAILYSKGKKDVLMAGILFSGIIFIMYMLYGLGILRAITTLKITNLFYAVVTIGAFVLSVMELNAYFNYKPGFLAVEMPMFLRPYARKVTENATSPLGVAVAALFCSLFLLPCSSGPYLMVLGMIAKAATLQTLTYLFVYNLVFILPMVAITVVVYMGKITIENVGEMKEKYVREIHLVSGVLLFMLFIIMFNQILKIV
ncbi:MAG: hypothetical protein ACP5KJ_02525 [Candidatus Micrarchaeia archaeon]